MNISAISLYFYPVTMILLTMMGRVDLKQHMGMSGRHLVNFEVV